MSCNRGSTEVSSAGGLGERSQRRSDVGQKAESTPLENKGFYSCCHLHPRDGWVRNPPWLPRCWQSRAAKLGGGRCAARAPAARGNCLPCPFLGPFCPSQRHSVCPSEGTARPCHPGETVAAAKPRSAECEAAQVRESLTTGF